MIASSKDNRVSLASNSIASSTANDAPPLCTCGTVTRLRLSKTEENPGRRFYGCGKYNFSSSLCGTFHWYDPEHPYYLKKFMSDIIRENKQLKADVMQQESQIAELQVLLEAESGEKKLLVEKIETYKVAAKRMKVLLFCVLFFMVSKMLKAV